MSINFSVGSVSLTRTHLLADLVELVLLLGDSNRDFIARGDVAGLVGKAPVELDELDDEEEQDDSQADGGLAFEPEGVVGLETMVEPSDTNENSKIDAVLDLLWEHFSYRVGAFLNFYPFYVDGDKIYVRKNLSIYQRVYVFLLACSRLKSFKGVFPLKGVRQFWAALFTKACRDALKGLFPMGMGVRIFDANSDDRQSYYGTNLRDALVRLGADLGASFVNHAAIKKESASGDAGLDLVAIYSFSDNASGALVAMGQCGAQGEGWSDKTLEAHSDKYRSFFGFSYPWTPLMFAPVCYRDTAGAWEKERFASGVLLLDRLRILKLISLQIDKYSWAGVSQPKWLLDFEDQFCAVKMA